MSQRLRLVILGMMGRCPFGGQTWLYLNWLRAFSRLGHEVWYVEDDTVWPYDPVRNTVTDDVSYAVTHIARSLAGIGLEDRWAYRLAGSGQPSHGLDDKGIDELYRTCDALLNVVGATDIRDEHKPARFRVYLECDPVLAELRLANGDEGTRIDFAAHHAVATYGENYGAGDCGVPLNGITYVKTRQPVDLDLWPMVYTPDAPDFTTIGNYRHGGNDVEYQGRIYTWSKHHQWERFIDLPRCTPQPIELAMTMTEEDRAHLESAGFRVVSPFAMSLDPFQTYPDYFHRSRAEVTVAKDQNVSLRSGWFSERDACYLATGKPVVAQDTGFGNILPTGSGLFAYTTTEEAVAAIAAINADYRRHCLAARAIAEEFFAAEKVGARLLADLGLA